MKAFPTLLTLLCMTLPSGLALAAPLSVKLSASDTALKCGATTTPAVAWQGDFPKGTKSLAALLWDQAPGKLTGRWLVFDLPVNAGKLAPMPSASLSVAGGKVAKNDAGQNGYTPVCAKGKHDLYLDFYALDVPSLNLPAGTPLRTVHTAIHKHKLIEAKAHLTWTVK